MVLPVCWSCECNSRLKLFYLKHECTYIVTPVVNNIELDACLLVVDVLVSVCLLCVRVRVCLCLFVCVYVRVGMLVCVGGIPAVPFYVMF